MKQRSSTSIQLEINKLQLELDDAIKYEENLELGDPKTIAIAFHEQLYNANHTDGCGWFYEVHAKMHDWNGSEHKRWLDKANINEANDRLVIIDEELLRNSLQDDIKFREKFVGL